MIFPDKSVSFFNIDNRMCERFNAVVLKTIKRERFFKRSRFYGCLYGVLYDCQLLSITGITSIVICSPSMASTGRSMPARLGIDISMVISLLSRLDNISSRNLELKPISILSPRYEHGSFSSARLPWSLSSAEIITSSGLRLRRVWCVVLLENKAMRRREFWKLWRSMSSWFGFSFGITAS